MEFVRIKGKRRVFLLNFVIFFLLSMFLSFRVIILLDA